jgi:hypothetical protein
MYKAIGQGKQNFNKNHGQTNKHRLAGAGFSLNI